MLGHGQQNLFHGKFEFFGGALDDADIGLVGHQPIEVGLGHTSFVQHRTCRAFQHAHGQFEHALAVHFQHRIAQNLAVLHMSGNAQQAHMLAVGMDIGGQNAGRVRGFQHHSTRTIAKQHAGGAVFEIQQTGKHFCADHQSTAGIAGANHGVGHAQRVNESGAHRLHIKRRSACDACCVGIELRQFVLQDAGGGGEHHVGRGGGDDDEVNVLGPLACGLQSVFAGLKGQIAAENTIRSKVPSANASSLDDPFVRAFHPISGELGDQIGIAQAARGKIGACTGNTGINSHVKASGDGFCCHGSCQQRRCMGQTALHACQQLVMGGIIRTAQGHLKRQSISRSVALKHQTAQTQQGRAIVTPVVNQFFKSS